MKILYLAHRIPYPPNKGDKIRSFNEIKFLAERHEVDLLCLADEPGDLRYKSDLEEYCQQVEVFPLNKLAAKAKGMFSLLCGQSITTGYFYLPAMQAAFDWWTATKNYDAILCFSSPMAEYVFKSSVKNISARLIMDFCDVDSDKWGQYAKEAKFPLRQLYWTEKKRLTAYERKIQSHFDHTVLISEAEAALFRRNCADHQEKLLIIPNGVDHAYFTPDYKPRTSNLEPRTLNLVFTGAMDYQANVDGVKWFCRDIFPELKKQYPTLGFYIVGSNPTDEVKALAETEGVIVTGFVDDIRNYYSMADVCVVPLRIARGIQNKVLEAMAMGKAVVSTANANAGIRAVDGENLLIANTEHEFISATEKLLENSQKRYSLEISARDFVVKKYDWRENLKLLDKIFIVPAP